MSTRALADRDLDLVASRAQGNPLFAVELARAISDSTSDGDELPDTIEQIIASRFDRLEPSARRLIRVASVLGNQFHEVIVTALFSAVDRTADVGAALASAQESGAIAATSRLTLGLQPCAVPRHRLRGAAVHTAQAAAPPGRGDHRGASRRHHRRRVAALVALFGRTSTRTGVALLAAGRRSRRSAERDERGSSRARACDEGRAVLPQRERRRARSGRRTTRRSLLRAGTIR